MMLNHLRFHRKLIPVFLILSLLSGATISAGVSPEIQVEPAGEGSQIFFPLMMISSQWGQGDFAGSFSGKSELLVVHGDLAFVGEGSRLALVDIQDPGEPVLLARVPLPGAVNAVEVSGDYAYVAAGYGGLVVLDIHDPARPARIGAVGSIGRANHVVMAGGVAYVSASRGLYLFDLSDPSHPRPRTMYSVPALRARVQDDLAFVDVAGGFLILEVSGFADPVLLSQNREYMLREIIGSRLYVTKSYCFKGGCADEFHILDITDPAAPASVAGYSISTSAEIEYLQVSGNLVYLVHGKTLDILDTRELSNLELAARYETSDYVYDLRLDDELLYVLHLHGIEVIDVSNPAEPAGVGGYTTSEFLSPQVQIFNRHLVLRTTQGGVLPTGFQILSLGRRTKPELVGKFETVPAYKVNYVQVEEGMAYIVGEHDAVDFANTRQGLWIVDVSDPTSPKQVGEYAPPEEGGVLFGGWPSSIQVAGRTAYVVTGFGTLFILDVSDPTSPNVLGSFIRYGTDAVRVAGSRAYLLSSGLDGGELQILDVSDPAHPALLGAYQAAPDKNTYLTDHAIQDGLAYLAVGDELHIVDVSDPAVPAKLGAYLVSPSPNGLRIAVSGNLAFLGWTYNYETSWIYILDVSDPAAPELLHSFTTPGAIQRIQAFGNRLYLSAGEAGVQVLDVSDPSHPVTAKQYGTFGYSVQPGVDGFTYIAGGEEGLQIFREP